MKTIRSPQNVPLVYEPPTNHHDGRINVAFADGHVECLPASAVPAFLARYGGAATQPSRALVPSTAPVEVE